MRIGPVRRAANAFLSACLLGRSADTPTGSWPCLVIVTPPLLTGQIRVDQVGGLPALPFGAMSKDTNAKGHEPSPHRSTFLAGRYSFTVAIGGKTNTTFCVANVCF